MDDGSAPETAEMHASAVDRVSREMEASGSPHRMQYVRSDRNRGKGAAIRSAALLPGTAVPDEGLAIAGIFGDASKLADALLRYPA